MEKRWMKPKEMAEYLSVHVKTIYRMIYAKHDKGRRANS
jgi:excisionase family DNA binding protein